MLLPYISLIYKVLSTWLFVDCVSNSRKLTQHVSDYLLFLHNFLDNGMVLEKPMIFERKSIVLDGMQLCFVMCSVMHKHYLINTT